MREAAPDASPVAPLVLALDDPRASLDSVGGKAESLVRLARAWLPVPPGFCLTTAAYRLFVHENAIDSAAPDLARGFETAPMPAAISAVLEAAYAPFANQPVAVRSSATAEDLPELSFAGQQETFLNVRGTAELELAVRRCWASLWSARAVAYRQHAGITQDVALAVVVQKLVPADAAGVAFSVDPVTGKAERVVVNGAWGLGESIVGGLVTPDVFEVDRATGAVVEQRVADKTEMTVAVESGTRQRPVAEALRRAPSLSSAEAQAIAHLALRIEALYGLPVDIEWAVAKGELFVLQARPITTLGALAGEQKDPWNDSRVGDFLWTSGNLGEAVPDVMTPVTWSLLERLSRDAIADIAVPGCPTVGNIGGRCYMNISLLYTLAAAFGASGRFAAANEEVFGRLPADLEIPKAPVSRWTLLRAIARPVPQLLLRTRRYQSRIPRFVADNPAHCETLRARIDAISDTRVLAYLWRTEIEPLYREGCFMLQAAGRQGNSALVMTRARLRAQVGEEDADALFSGLHSEDRQLASLGLLEGLQQVASGRIDGAVFARRFGHRGPHEFEVSQPRPGEDPRWLEEQLEQMHSGELQRLFEHRRQSRTEAWDRFARQQPATTVNRVRRDVEEWGRIARDREATRSELVRVFWVMRDFLLRGAQLTNTGDDVFYLPIDDVVSVLAGTRSMPEVGAARAAFARYAALPAYPRLIRGRFDPFAWAADPDRRRDLFVAGGASVPSSDVIVGFPGAAGVVEATARVLETPEEGDQLQAGEVLVTRVTNVGWTPLFPRASAVVTDVGAPLSHAAIVARELGIPAVVGCGNATMLLRTGMRVRVDGSRGTVEVL